MKPEACYYKDFGCKELESKRTSTLPLNFEADDYGPIEVCELWTMENASWRDRPKNRLSSLPV